MSRRSLIKIASVAGAAALATGLAACSSSSSSSGASSSGGSTAGDTGVKFKGTDSRGPK